jgi:hypothetical protein
MALATRHQVYSLIPFKRKCRRSVLIFHTHIIWENPSSTLFRWFGCCLLSRRNNFQVNCCIIRQREGCWGIFDIRYHDSHFIPSLFDGLHFVFLDKQIRGTDWNTVQTITNKSTTPAKHGCWKNFFLNRISPKLVPILSGNVTRK